MVGSAQWITGGDRFSTVCGKVSYLLNRPSNSPAASANAAVGAVLIPVCLLRRFAEGSTCPQRSSFQARQRGVGVVGGGYVVRSLRVPDADSRGSYGALRLVRGRPRGAGAPTAHVRRGGPRRPAPGRHPAPGLHAGRRRRRRAPRRAEVVGGATRALRLTARPLALGAVLRDHVAQPCRLGRRGAGGERAAVSTGAAGRCASFAARARRRNAAPSVYPVSAKVGDVEGACADDGGPPTAPALRRGVSDCPRCRFGRA